MLPSPGRIGPPNDDTNKWCDGNQGRQGQSEQHVRDITARQGPISQINTIYVNISDVNYPSRDNAEHAEPTEMISAISAVSAFNGSSTVCR